MPEELRGLHGRHCWTGVRALSSGQPSVVLVGFMGSGKSTIARSLGRRLAMPVVDLDAMIAEWAGAAIPALFRGVGEPVFRALEAAAVQVAARGAASVIATGGGSVVNSASAAALRSSGLVVYLSAPAETLVARVGRGKGRPMVSGSEDRVATMYALLAAREPVYRAVAHMEVETSTASVASASAAIAERYRQVCVAWER